MSGTGSAVVVGALTEIPPGEGRAFAVAGKQIAVFRLRDDTVRAVSAICPHRGGPIADGQIDREVVICPLHLNAFELATGCSRTGAPDLATYAAFVDADGMVAVDPDGVTGP